MRHETTGPKEKNVSGSSSPRVDAVGIHADRAFAGVGDSGGSGRDRHAEVHEAQQPYLKRDVPKDPWGNDYVYRYPGQHNQEGYDLHSNGPDGKLGGDDDITNWTEDE